MYFYFNSLHCMNKYLLDFFPIKTLPTKTFLLMHETFQKLNISRPQCTYNFLQILWLNWTLKATKFLLYRFCGNANVQIWFQWILTFWDLSTTQMWNFSFSFLKIKLIQYKSFCHRSRTKDWMNYRS